ncbi:MAG: isopentenyl phosphate kinase [Acidobacteriota bacterium]
MTTSEDQRPLVLVKLGGSLLTDKRRIAKARSDVIERLARELAAVRTVLQERLIVGHGSGSFGHAVAARHQLGDTEYHGDAFGIAETQLAAAELHRRVVSAFIAAGVPAWSWAPSTGLESHQGKPRSAALEPVVHALSFDLMPVVYGDVVLDEAWRATICSTEVVLTNLIHRLRRRGFEIARVLWVGATPGVLDARGATIPTIDGSGWRAALEAAHGAAGTDVTGGMRHRLDTARALVRLGVESWIVDGSVPGVLAAALRGDAAAGGTRCIVD